MIATRTESFSSINTYLRCAFKYKKKYIENLQPKRQGGTLRQGSAMHHLLMGGFLALQRGDDWQTGVDEHVYALVDEAENTAQFEEEFREVDEMIWESRAIIRRYFEQADWEGWEILHVEEEFTVIIDGQEITFTPDLVARDPNGNVWIIDHKSATSIPDGIPFSSQQSLLYFAGVQAHYPEAVGFMFNWIRKKLPTEPRLNKTRTKDTGLYHVNNLKAVDTEYEMLFKFIQEEAPELFSEDGHKQRLAELRDGGSNFFGMQRVLANESALSQIVDETSQILKHIEFSVEQGSFPRTLRDDNGYESCERCEFHSICAAELLDLNTDIVLMDYEPRTDKNPYESKEDQ